jgi:ubiquinone/menaquinone biosynthesis C-methylase UbiE
LRKPVRETREQKNTGTDLFPHIPATTLSSSEFLSAEVQYTSARFPQTMCPRILAVTRHFYPAQNNPAALVRFVFLRIATGIEIANRAGMLQPSLSNIDTQLPFSGSSAHAVRSLREDTNSRWNAFHGLQRRWNRERRRRKVGRAYDMALEIARAIPGSARILDVGCGNGFIAHHLSALMGASVTGIDLGSSAEAGIDYRKFDGKYFPIEDQSVDAVLLCYVLHHAQDVGVVMAELRRVLSKGGHVVVFEDIPAGRWDQLVCWTHNLKWRKRTGACTFRRAPEWQDIFNDAGFEVVSERALSRWRNLAHPVRRQRFVLRKIQTDWPSA